MTTTLVTSCLSLLSITIGSLIVSKKIKQVDEKSDQLLASVWFFIGVTFFFMTLRTSLFTMGFINADHFFAFIVQIVLISYYIVFSKYVIHETFRNQKIKIILYFIVFIFGSIFTFLLFKDGLVGPFISDWGSEYSVSPRANLSIILSGVMASVFLFYNFLEQIFRYLKNKEKFIYKKFLSYLSLIIFIIVGVFEQLGNIGWVILFLRISILLSILIVYSAYDREKYKIKI